MYETELTATLAAVLEVDRDAIDVDAAFSELGLDSIAAVQWIRTINARYGLTWPTAILFDFPNLRALAACLARSLQGGAESPHRSIAHVVEPVAHGPIATDGIAIIGMSGRFPCARTVDELWRNVVEGRDCVSEIPPVRWPLDGFYDAVGRRGRSRSKWMGVVDDVDRFDAPFFAISRTEAELMDPQQRLILEEVWHCFEDAAIDPAALAGTACGFFVGCSRGDYGVGAADAMTAYGAMGVSPAILAGRVAYALNLIGPCLSIDTGSSSSLVAVAQACDSLVLRRCDVALAAGVSVLSAPAAHLAASDAGMLSPHGRCFTFDARADGFVPAEAVAVVLLKRLEDARRDRDRIYAVLRGWHVNQDGRTNGITAPSAASQARLQTEVHARFGIHPDSISLVEAHGTGTKLGDPIEVAALKMSFGASTDRQGFCALGSVKSNIGHAIAAAGVVGLIKAALALAHRTLPPTIHVNRLNEQIALEGSPFYINTVARPWTVEDGLPRRAAVNSFGFSGTNAHVVVEESGQPDGGEGESAPADQPVIVVLAARNTDRLVQQARQLLAVLTTREFGDRDLRDIAYTLQVGRSAMAARLAFVVRSLRQLVDALASFTTGNGGAAALHFGELARNSGFESLATDEDFAATVDAWIAKGKHERVAELWAKGLPIDWSRLYAGQPPRRIALPGYPFAEDRYWCAPAAAPGGSGTADAVLPERVFVPPAEAPDGLVGTLALTPVWQPVTFDTSGVDSADACRELLFTDREADAHWLRRGCDAVQIATIEAADTVEALVGKVGDQPVRRLVVSFMSVAAADDRWRSDDSAPVVWLFRLVKALLRLGYSDRDLDLTVVTANACAMSGEDDVHPALAAVHGLIGSLAKEQPRWSVRLVDVDARADGEVPDVLAIPPDADGNAWMLRGTQYFQQRLMPVPASRSQSPAFVREGVYVVIGGAGAIGTRFTEDLLQRYEAQVVWLGRRSVDAAIRAALDRLNASRPAVSYIDCDATDAASLDAACREIKARYPRIHGIIHSAVVLSGSDLALMDERRFSLAFEAKAAVCRQIARAFAPEPSPVVVFFSSLESFEKTARQANYAAGCAFVDAFAHQLRRTWPAPVKVINWGYWGGVGRADASEPFRNWLEQAGMDVITPAESFAALERLMAGTVPQMVFARTTRPGALRVLGAAPGPPLAAADGVPTDSLADYVRATIIDQIAAALKVDGATLAPDEPLASYGVDSILAIRTVDALNRRLGIKLTSTSLFDYSSIDKLSDHVVAVHGPRIALPSRGVAVDPVPAARVVAPVPAVSAPAGPPVSAGRSRHADARDRECPIAVIGMSGRFAHARTLDELWTCLASGADLTDDVLRWDLASVLPGSNACRRGAFLSEIDTFDALFFNISGVEATYTDPQHRIFLEEAWKALEDAGHAGAAVEGRRVGVYAGFNGSDYARLFDAAPPPQALWGNAASVLSARIAYHLDLQGPAITVDTACSSSLVAAHLACQALWAGEIDVAVAGGAFVQCTPDFYGSGNRAGMLSPSGRCYVFDERADGFVPGEGAGVVVLKRLPDALADRDRICGVIRGSGINQDGATSGITAPSARSQTRLEREVYDRFGISADDLQMVEAHGTGTRLGDPIEWQALTEAFRKDTLRRAFCAIGSIKSNIGHTTAASGVAGLIKVLLSLQHRQIPPSLNFVRGNPHIDFDDTPFYVNSTLREWQVPVGALRRAALSSFGMSGTNAHMVIEEAPVPDADAPSEGPHLVVLSARTIDQLRDAARNLLMHCQRHPELNCADVSYTLLTGRRHLAVRFTACVQTLAELSAALDGWLATGTARGVAAGKVKEGHHHGDAASARLTRDAVIALGGLRGDERRDALIAIAGRFVEGHRLEPTDLFRGERRRRVGLPTYPFAADRFWVGPSPRAHGASGRVIPGFQPLLRAEAADGPGRHYRAIFTGREPFFRDHVIHGVSILPAVVHLEMARAAVDDARPRSDATLHLTDVTFAHALDASDSPIELAVDLADLGGGTMSVVARSGAADDQETVHCTAKVSWSDAEPQPSVDLAALRQLARATYSGDECYAHLASLGAVYGPMHRGVQRVVIAISDTGLSVAVADIAIPESVRDGAAAYVLHPSVLDAGLQAAAAFELNGGTAGHTAKTLPVPFCIDRMEVYAALPAAAVACVTRRATEGTATRILDVDLCTRDGAVCARLIGVAARPVPPASADETTLWVPRWRAEPLDPPAGPAPGRLHWLAICPCGTADEQLAFREYAARLQEALPRATCELLPACPTSPESALGAIARFVLSHMHRLLRGQPPVEVCYQVVLPSHPNGALCAAISALLRTANSESSHLTGQVILLDQKIDAPRMAERLAADTTTNATRISYSEGVRHVEAFEGAASAPTHSPWKSGGVYLISGGLGGLGLVFAREICAQVNQPTLVLLGRSALDDARRAALADLEARGAAIEYHRVDVSHRDQVRDVVGRVVARRATIDGILHAAGVLRDSFLIHKTADDLDAVLSPKVAGVVNLDEATAELPLDFFVMFSSLSAVLGSAGQADYATANAFLAAYAEQREALVRAGQRRGRSLAIDWPLWTDGGMRVEITRLRQIARHGVLPIGTTGGLAAFYRAFGQPDPHVVLLGASPARTRLLDGAMTRPVIRTESGPNPKGLGQPADAATLGAVGLLRTTFADTLQLPVDSIEEAAPFEQYGIDSLLTLQLTAALEELFGSLPKTLLFEYQSLGELAGYFLARHRGRLEALLIPSRSSEAPGVSSAASTPPTEDASRAPAPLAIAPLPIAIVGVAGRYPQARDLDTFWANLCAGHDAITEIPRDRWDHARYFDPERGKRGKTYSKWGGFIDGVDQFDPLFFNISPAEAERLDPQERLFLQCVYEAVEEAGYTRGTIAPAREGTRQGRVGVFVGVMYEEYQLIAAAEQARGRPLVLMGSAASIANRVSYFFNWQGPSLAVDTMCSSSLTALHLACQSLRLGECAVAVAGGVNVSIHPNKYLLLAAGQFASSTGRCRSFGEGGDGYVPSEGVGAVVLKPLAQAIADGDHIHAVIKGTAINHGGKTNGYTVPNPNAQSHVIADALQQSGVHPRAISYIEAHGTGTSLGDPIEVAALSHAFAAATGDTQFCAIGSVKSNIGHAESAAGIAGVTKVLLQMRHGTLVPSIHAERVNPHIDFTNTPFVLQRELEPWRRPQSTEAGVVREHPRIAGVSAFGAGGANAHVIVEEYRALVAPDPALAVPRPAMVVLSARGTEPLLQQARNLLRAIETRRTTDADLASLAYTLQVGREAMRHRLGIAIRGMDELRDTLTRFVAGQQDLPNVYVGERKDGAESGVAAISDELVESIDHGRAEQILTLWSKGGAVDWQRLYRGARLSRMSLPPYPFAEERCWCAATIDVEPVAAHAHSASADPDERIYETAWRAAPLTPGGRTDQPVAILTTAETLPLARTLCQYLPMSEVYVLDGGATPPAADWSRHVGWIDVGGSGTVDHGTDWMLCLRRWLDCATAPRLTALAVTRGLEACDNTRVSLAGGTRAGLYRMLQSEDRRVRSRHIDLDPAAPLDECGALIAAELWATSDESQVCYRGGRRLRAWLTETGVDRCTSSDLATPLSFGADRVLWITGGSRGLGYECASHFVRRHGVRRLMLSGRDPLPPREAWDTMRHQDDTVGRKVRGVLALETAGAEVWVSSVPLTDETALAREIRQVTRAMGPIGGLLHCAGAIDRETPAFSRKTADGLARVFAPKVAGLDAVLRTVARQPLEFVVLFSSVSAAIPRLAVGQADYAAANAYMDYVAQARVHGLPIVSVRWPSWKDSGFGEATGAVYRESGLLTLSNADGLRLLDRIIERSLGPVVMPLLVDAARWNADRVIEHEARGRAAAPIVQSAPPREGGDTSSAAIERWLRQLVARELKLDPDRLDVDTPLLDYGVNSVMLVQLLRPVGDAVGAALDPSILFQYPTVSAFARWLLNEHRAALPPDMLQTPDEPTTVAVSAALRTEVEPRPHDLAIVGFAGRFPGAPTATAYWQLLAEGRSALAPLPSDTYPGRQHLHAGLLEGIRWFDPGFFHIPVADARAMDPQARLALEDSVAAWLHAGYALSEARGARVGVYLGARTTHRPDQALLREAQHPVMIVGQNYLAANVSKFLDFRGPSLVVDTACSSALTALHLAGHALRSGEIAAALVGGVSVLDPAAVTLFERRGILSAHADFHLFDRRAHGTVLGEAAAFIVVKTIEQARRDDDTIYAVVKAVALNNDGRTAGPAAPNPEAQAAVMVQALSDAAVRPEDVGYIEVSGSGSEVTDLLELKAIGSVYRSTSLAPCLLGSMKPNIGHPLCAEGIASIVKVVLMLRHRRLVPFLSAHEPMSHYDFSTSPFVFARALENWNGPRRLAAINCFADGGTNAHVVLEGWAGDTAVRPGRQPLPVPEWQRIDLAAAGVASDTLSDAPTAQGSVRSGFWRRLPALQR